MPDLNENETFVSLQVDSTNPQVMRLIERMHGAIDGTAEHALARAELLAFLSRAEYIEAGVRLGHQMGYDAGAAPFLEGPWWRRAWTAARS